MFVAFFGMLNHVHIQMPTLNAQKNAKNIYIYVQNYIIIYFKKCRKNGKKSSPSSESAGKRAENTRGGEATKNMWKVHTSLTKISHRSACLLKFSYPRESTPIVAPHRAQRCPTESEKEWKTGQPHHCHSWCTEKLQSKCEGKRICLDIEAAPLAKRLHVYCSLHFASCTFHETCILHSDVMSLSMWPDPAEARPTTPSSRPHRMERGAWYPQVAADIFQFLFTREGYVPNLDLELP